MSKHVMEDLLEIVCKELENISDKKALDPTSLANLDKLIDIKKDILEVMEMETEIPPDDSGYSGNYSGRMRNKMGRYSRSGNGYSQGYGNGYVIQPYHQPRYSYNNSEQEMIQNLRAMADGMPQHKRDAAYDFINRLESM